MNLTWSNAIQAILVVGGATFAGLAWAGELGFGKPEPKPVPAVLAPPAARAILSEGRVVTYPGKQVVLSAEISGPLRQMFGGEKMGVEKGALLAQIGVDDARAALREAWARAHEASVDAKYAKTELRRTSTLVQSNALPKAQQDRAVHDRSAATARHQAAGAAAARITTLLDKGAVKAPIDGTILQKHASEGEYVSAGAPLYTIADLRALRVELEVDEFDGSRVSIGQPVSVWAEGYPRVRGVVEEIPDEVVPRRIRPLDPGRPTDTRVLLVKVRFLEPSALRLGQRVEVEISPAAVLDLDRPTPAAEQSPPPAAPPGHPKAAAR